MARFWSDKDANGKPLTDGRVCLVITNDDDRTLPALRTYGRDKDEVLEKLARTTETAQATISRLRKTPAPSAPATPTAPASRVSADEQARATADLSNPAKAPEAVKVLLRAGGVDVDEAQRIQEGRRIAALAQEWERRNPEFPADNRNRRMLMDRALLRGHVTAETLDTAHRELMNEQQYHEPTHSSTVPSPGREESRTVGREATSYRGNTLRSIPPIAPSTETAKEERWRKILTEGTTKELGDAIRNEKGFVAWADTYRPQKTA